MKYIIYQLPTSHPNIFEHYEYIQKAVKRSDYVAVYNGRIGKKGDDHNKALESLFCKFNVNRPTNFAGHSLSVSDVVWLEGHSYYCDALGWKEIRDWR